MQITACKKSTKSLKRFRYICGLLSQRTLGMPNHTQIKQHDNTVGSMDMQHAYATNKQNNSTLPKDIGALLFWKTLGMLHQTQQMLHDLTKASVDIYLHAKYEPYASNSFTDIKV